ncbi:MAG: hypothetical protein ACOX0E_08060 [Syntrophomonadaceae bacterium]
MLEIFGATGIVEGIFSNPLAGLLVILLSIWIFFKYCKWARKFQLSGGVKKIVFILTGLGLLGFNILYYYGNSMVLEGDWTHATLALVAALIWVFVFAFALMAETKAE